MLARIIDLARVLSGVDSDSLEECVALWVDPCKSRDGLLVLSPIGAVALAVMLIDAAQHANAASVVLSNHTDGEVN